MVWVKNYKFFNKYSLLECALVSVSTYFLLYFVSFGLGSIASSVYSEIVKCQYNNLLLPITLFTKEDILLKITGYWKSQINHQNCISLITNDQQ